MRFVIASVRCRVCGESLVSEMVPASSTAEQDDAEKQAQREVHAEFKRRASHKGLAFKARTCSPQCYGTLPNWNRILFRVLPMTAGWFQ